MAFTSEQNMIIEHENGHALVEACPGSGKTTTMVALALNLIQKGVSPKDILILTFGAESKKDFSKRLADKAAEQGISTLPEARTFHSLGNSILDAFVKRGYAKSATLETSSKKTEMIALNVLKATIGQREFKEVAGKSQTIIEDFLGFVDFIKSGFLSPKEVFELLGLNPEFRFFIQAFDNFEEHRKKNKIRFFSDLLYDPINILLAREDVRAWIGGKKKYIIVDEYQDTNIIQHEFIKIVAGDKASVIVVGDPRQSIYEWRGSSPELMLHQFEKDFKNPTRYKLSRTFRYGHLLSLMANSLIVHNDEGQDSLCVSGREDIKTEVSIVGYKNVGLKALEIIKSEIDSGRDLKDISVLVRLYSSAAPIELELLREGINYKLQGGYSCLYSREMKNLEFMLQLATKQHVFLKKDALVDSYIELLKFPHMGCKNDVVEQLATRLAGIGEDENPGVALSRIRNLEEKVYIRQKLIERADIIQQIICMGREGKSAKQILDYYIRNTELYKSIQKMAMSSLEYSERRERCEVFVRYVDGLGKDVLSVLDGFQELREKQFTMAKDEDGVVITSIHKAKGLEWPVVILPGLESSRFPYESKNESLTTLESERRLFYVGMTRAIGQLYLMCPDHPELKKEIEFGSGSENNLLGERTEPSSFIFEIKFKQCSEFSAFLDSNEEPPKFHDDISQQYWNELAISRSVV